MSRWLEQTGGTRGGSYDEAFTELAASGADVHGEASFVDALLDPGSRVLDAGCGTGRVAVELHRRGHDVVGVDSDASMLAVARTHPGPDWQLADLQGFSGVAPFDLVLLAGNVVVYLAPGTEPEVLTGLAGLLRPGGLLVSGWCTRRAPDDPDSGAPSASVSSYDRWVSGLSQVGRYATWSGDPLTPAASWCVAVDARDPV